MKIVPFLLFALFLCTSFSVRANPLTIVNLVKALKTHKISVKAISTKGGYKGKGVRLSLKNNTGKPLKVYIDPGMIFVPKDTAYQHLVLLGNEYLAMQGNEEVSVELQTYCGKSYARAPKEGLDYKYWKQGDSTMINVLSNAKSKSITPTLVQHMVWMFTNGHCISGVYDYSKPDMSRQFVQYLSKTLHITPPEYFVKAKLNEGNASGPVYVQGSDTIYVDIHWKFIPRRNLHVSVYNSRGEVIKKIMDNEVITGEGHTITVTFLPGEYPDGLYYVKMFDDENAVYITKQVYIGRHC